MITPVPSVGPSPGNNQNLRAIKSFLLISLSILLIAVLAIVSLLLGVANVTPSMLVDPYTASQAWEILLISRFPRTIALILAGTSMAVAGLIMQMLVRNRFVEPSTAGTVESATLGILVVTLVVPGALIPVKMLIATIFAMTGTLLFLLLLRKVPLRSPFLVPVIGLVLGGVIQAITTFIAYRFDLLQSLHAWSTGDFSGILVGRYEFLWVGLLLAILAYVIADKFTVIGMGEQFTKNLGIPYKRLITIGLIIVSAMSAVVVVTAGTIPFLGLLIPNIVSLFIGDNLRRSIPWVAYTGAVFVLACDIIGRGITYPNEIPIGTVVGVVGSFFFLYLLLGRHARAN